MSINTPINPQPTVSLQKILDYGHIILKTIPKLLKKTDQLAFLFIVDNLPVRIPSVWKDGETDRHRLTDCVREERPTSSGNYP